MPTIDDLRDAFAARAQDAPGVPELLAALPAGETGPAHRRPRPGAVATGVAAVGLAAATVVAVVATAGGDHRTTRTAAPPTRAGHVTSPVSPTAARTAPAATRLEFAFTLGQVPGYTLDYDGVQADQQLADVSVAGRADKSIGDIRVYSRGAFDPAPAREHGTAVTVSGHPGYWTRIPDPDTAGRRGVGTATWSVVWQYAPDAWAVVQGDWAQRIADGDLSGDAKTIELAVAGAVDTTRTHPLPVPIRLTYLPAGLTVHSARVAPDASQAQVGLSDGGPTDPAYPDNTDSVQIEIHANEPTRGAPSIGLGRPVPLPGAPSARVYPDGPGATVTVVYPDRYLTVAYLGTDPRRTSDAELLRIARGIRISPSMRDRGTWFDGLTVGP